jgi:hypothetical protein
MQPRQLCRYKCTSNHAILTPGRSTRCLRNEKVGGVSGEEKLEAQGEPAHEIEEDAEGPGIREWFDGLPKVQDGGRAAAFDTRLPSGLAGGAARGIARRLRRHDYHLVSDPEGFIVDDSYGPLRTGEVERAKQWGAQLVSQTVRSLG